MSNQALTQLQDPNLSEKEKLALMEIIQLVPYKQKSLALFSCLKNQVPLRVQEEALRQLSNYREKEIGNRIIEMWSEMSPSTRRLASDLLLYVELYHDALLSALEKGKIQIGEMNFDLERRRMLIAWDTNPENRKRANKLLSDEEIISRKEVVAKMKPALSLKGKQAEGEKVFQAICSNCHKYENIGNDVGPVLTEINRKSKESIMHDILDPNAAVNTQYISHQIKTKDGMLHIGVIDSENDESVVMKKMGGEKITFNKKSIMKMNSMGKSLMMEGLEGSLTHQQMADLLSFLQKQ
jgi:putative heme-binding domain-containing protein